MVILAVAVVVVISAVAVWLLFFHERPVSQLSQEEIVKKQLEELNKNPQPLSQDEIGKQLEEIKENPQPLSEEEINKQLEELKGQ